jgi:hypothetical protein
MSETESILRGIASVVSQIQKGEARPQTFVQAASGSAYHFTVKTEPGVIRLAPEVRTAAPVQQSSEG